MIKPIFKLLILVLLIQTACGEPQASEENQVTVSNDQTNGIAKTPISQTETPTIKKVYNLNPTGTTNSGYEYIKHIDGKQKQIQPGEYAYFSFYVKMRDDIVGSSEGGDLGKLRIDSLDLVTTKQPSPVMDVLREMGVGDSCTVYWPANQVPQMPEEYKDEPFVRYDIVLKEIKNEEQYQADVKRMEEERRVEVEATRKRKAGIEKQTADLAKQYREGKLTNKLKTTESGLKYIIHEQGKGKTPKKGQGILAHYYGMLTDGSTFDNSFERGQPFNFPLGQGRVIEGWDEAFALFNPGTKATIFVPYQLAYGEAGRPPSIPERSELIFYVELQKVY